MMNLGFRVPCLYIILHMMTSKVNRYIKQKEVVKDLLQLRRSAPDLLWNICQTKVNQIQKTHINHCDLRQTWLQERCSPPQLEIFHRE